MQGGVISEHEARGSKDHEEKAGSYDPTPEEKKAIKLVERLFERGKKHRALYDDKWLDNYRMFRGRQWKEQRPKFRHSEVVNMIFRTIQSQVPQQVDTRPKTTFIPENPGDMEFAEILNQVNEADWAKNSWSEQVLEVIYDANFYGTGISGTFARKVKGKVKPVYESMDPFYTFPDPDARDTNKDCAWLVYAEPTNVRKIKKRYPDKRDWLKPDLVDMMDGSKTDISPMKFKTPIDQASVVSDSGNTVNLANQEKALVLTAWLAPEFTEDDYEEVEVRGKDPETGADTVEYEQRAKYPRGRKIVICNGILLEDGDAGYDDGEIPFERYVNYLLPREFWGISEVEQLEGPQKTFNKMVSFALDVMTLMGNPIWKVHAGSGVDPENIRNQPGLVIEWDGDPAHEPKREEGVQLQPYVLQMIDRMEQWFNDTAGSQDVSRGAAPGGVTAFKAISALQEAGLTRIRQKQRNLDVYLQHVGRHWHSRTMQFRTVPDIVRLTEKDGIAQRYFKMHVEEFEKTEPGVDPVTGAEIQVPTGEMGKRAVVQPYGENGFDPMQMRTFEVQGDMDVQVSTGSSLPFAKDELEQKLLAYFDRGIIDDEEVLKRSEYPNYESVLARIRQKKQMEAQAAMQAEAMGQAPQGAPAA